MDARWTVALVAGAVLVGAGTVALGSADGTAEAGSAGPAQAPSGPLIEHVPGSELVYEGPRSEVTVHVHEPRSVRAADWALVEAVPLTLVEDGEDEPRPGSPVRAEAVETGGLAVLGQHCDLDPQTSCEDAEGGLGISWQFCPLTAGWTTPFNTLTGEDLEDPPVEVREPTWNLTWTYEVAWEGPDRVRLSITEGSPQPTACDPTDEAVIDVEERTLVARSDDGPERELTEVRRGGADPVPMGAGRLDERTFVADDEPRRHVYPAGAGPLGPSNWTLGQAWSTAEEDEDVQAFLAENPEAFVTDADPETGNTTWTGGAVHEERYAWTLNLVGTSNEPLEVEAEVTVTQVGPVEHRETHVKTGEGQPLEDAEPGFEPPRRTAAGFQAVVDRVRELGLEAPPEDDPWFSTFVDEANQVAFYQYFVPIEGEAEETTEGGDGSFTFTGAFQPPTVIGTGHGRLQQLSGDDATRERVFDPGS